MLGPPIHPFDSRRDLYIAKDPNELISFATAHWIHSGQRAIQQRGKFAVALSGGSTPKAIYQALAKEKHSLDWSRVWLFWSDERSVPPDHPDSNYRMAMESFSALPLTPSQIFRMQAEKDLERNAFDYQQKIRHFLKEPFFDLVMLGLGEDGHTASLFPNTSALSVEDRLVVPNEVPQLKTCRMTFTFPCIEQSAQIALYAVGAPKAKMVSQVLNAPILSPFPASRIGSPSHKALWILDQAAAAGIYTAPAQKV